MHLLKTLYVSDKVFEWLPLTPFFYKLQLCEEHDDNQKSLGHFRTMIRFYYIEDQKRIEDRISILVDKMKQVFLYLLKLSFVEQKQLVHDSWHSRAHWALFSTHLNSARMLFLQLIYVSHASKTPVHTLGTVSMNVCLLIILSLDCELFRTLCINLNFEWQYRCLIHRKWPVNVWESGTNKCPVLSITHSHELCAEQVLSRYLPNK